MADDAGQSAGPAPARDRDWLLAEIVKMTNLGLGFDIVLFAAGQTIAGKTISAEAYFEALAKLTEAGSPLLPLESRPMLDTIALFFRGFKSVSMRPENAAPDFVMPPPNYIHLESARILGEDKDMPTTGGMLWRGRLCDITGFALGTLTRS